MNLHVYLHLGLTKKNKQWTRVWLCQFQTISKLLVPLFVIRAQHRFTQNNWKLYLSRQRGYCECEHVAYRNLSFLMYFIRTPFMFLLFCVLVVRKSVNSVYLLFPHLKLFQTSPDGNVYSDTEYVLETERLDE